VDELPKTRTYAIGLWPYLQDPYGKASQEPTRLALVSIFLVGKTTRIERAQYSIKWEKTPEKARLADVLCNLAGLQWQETCTFGI
jgi:hypothetical protein